jgi:hypothetical protein
VGRGWLNHKAATKPGRLHRGSGLFWTTTTSRSWRRWPLISWRSELTPSDPKVMAHCFSGFAGEHSDGITKGYWDKTLEMGRTSTTERLRCALTLTSAAVVGQGTHICACPLALPEVWSHH